MALNVVEGTNADPTGNLVYDPDTLSWVRMTQPVVHADVVNVSGQVEVAGPLTNTELRASDVKITLDSEKVVVSDLEKIGNIVVPRGPDGELRCISQDYLQALAEGDIANHVPWSKMGFNGTVGTSQETMWTYSTEYVFPTAAGQIQVVSSDNTQDKAGGTGALTVRVGYLKSDYSEGSVTLTLNGTTPVASGASHADVWRVNSFRVMTTGTNLGPVGNLTLSYVTGGLVVGYIRIGKTRSRTCVYTVPLGKTLYVTSIAFSCAGTKYMIFTTHANYDTATGSLLQRGMFHPYSEVALLNSAYQKPLLMPTMLPATTDLKVSVVAEAAGSIGTCHLRGWLE